MVTLSDIRGLDASSKVTSLIWDRSLLSIIAQDKKCYIRKLHGLNNDLNFSSDELSVAICLSFEAGIAEENSDLKNEQNISIYQK